MGDLKRETNKARQYQPRMKPCSFGVGGNDERVLFENSTVCRFKPVELKYEDPCQGFSFEMN
ncbi:hypothetical protein ACOBQX_09870 [Actinokineospora sp. G85]|uniref:hypothetical protein n=1 Tax=Actinokineospora sp. G85 TaxID=3406626 RepID=UPI003C75B8D9